MPSKHGNVYGRKSGQKARSAGPKVVSVNTDNIPVTPAAKSSPNLMLFSSLDLVGRAKRRVGGGSHILGSPWFLYKIAQACTLERLLG